MAYEMNKAVVEAGVRKLVDEDGYLELEGWGEEEE